MALAVDAAVSAAQSGDAAAFTDATANLSRFDREQLAVLLGAITRDLLERSHPDGLDSEMPSKSCELRPHLPRAGMRRSTATRWPGRLLARLASATRTKHRGPTVPPW